MEKPWLSVVVPCLNGERWIATALQSLVDQKEPGIEVLVVDGSANDTGLRIVDSFSDKLNIRAHHRPDLVPYTAATNFGVEQATSDRICILHVDDIWLPNRAAKLREWLAVQSDGVMHLHPSTSSTDPEGDWDYGGVHSRSGHLRFRYPCYLNDCWFKTLYRPQRSQYAAMCISILGAWIISYGLRQIGIYILRSLLLAMSTTIRAHWRAIEFIKVLSRCEVAVTSRIFESSTRSFLIDILENFLRSKPKK